MAAAKKKSNKRQILDIEALPKGDRDQIAEAIKQLVTSEKSIAFEKENQKEIIDFQADKFAVDKRMIRKLAKAKYKQSLSADKSEFEKLERTYDLLFGSLTDEEEND